jgi:hypothetical protein
MTEGPRRIAPGDLPRLAPKLKPCLRSPLPAWRDIADAADSLRRDLGIPKTLGGRLRCYGPRAGGRGSRYHDDEGTGRARKSRRLFRAMLAKHSAGELSLERTVWRLRHAIDQERYGANGSPLTAEGSIP